MKKILVTGAGGPAGVNVLRSLRDSGEEMKLYGTDISAYHVEFARPFLDKVFIVPTFDHLCARLVRRRSVLEEGEL